MNDSSHKILMQVADSVRAWAAPLGDSEKVSLSTGVLVRSRGHKWELAKRTRGRALCRHSWLTAVVGGSQMEGDRSQRPPAQPRSLGSIRGQWGTGWGGVIDSAQQSKLITGSL